MHKVTKYILETLLIRENSVWMRAFTRSLHTSPPAREGFARGCYCEWGLSSTDPIYRVLHDRASSCSSRAPSALNGARCLYLETRDVCDWEDRGS